MTTKMLVATTVLAAAIASPALAQTAAPQRSQVQTFPFEQSFRPNGQPHSVNRGYDVYQQGQYVGSDPDPNIRLQLRREHDNSEW
jgi:hypothetical protein